MKRSWAIVLVAVLVVLLAGLFYTKAGHALAVQPPLPEINSQALSGLEAEFNRVAPNVRVILLLSPT